jgi:hypothetical protein
MNSHSTNIYSPLSIKVISIGRTHIAPRHTLKLALQVILELTLEVILEHMLGSALFGGAVRGCSKELRSQV